MTTRWTFFHTTLAIEAGLLKGIVEYCHEDRYPAFADGQHITWIGDDFIDNARSDTAAGSLGGWKLNLRHLVLKQNQD